MAILKTEAIVLKTFDLRETSRIAVFFTEEYGKVSGVLKGIRKDSKKFGSSVDRFSVNDIVYYQYRNSDLHLISQCDLKEFYYPLRRDLRKSMAATYALELVYKIMPSEEKNPQVYQLMKDFFESLQEGDDVDQLVHAFQIKILLHSGFRPHLDACVRTKKKIVGKALFSVKDGGLIAADEPVLSKETYPISPGTTASILHIENNEWEKCLRLKLTEVIRKELKYILNNFLVFHLGKQIKSARFVNS